MSDGRRQIGAFHLPGDIFGLENGGFHRFTAEAIVDTTVRLIKRQSLERVAKTDPAMVRSLLNMTTDNLQHVDHVAVKTEMLKLRLMEKQHELVRRSDVDALIDDLAGVTLTALSSMPARCAPRGDLATRRVIERVVFEVRTEIAKVCQQKADERDEPPLDDNAGRPAR